MRTLLPIILLLTLSCSNPKNQINNRTPTSNASKSDKSKFYTTANEAIIITETFDTLKFSKQEFNEIVDNCPELYSDDIKDPDFTYSCKKKYERFGSEVGQDAYYILYGYFLKKRNGVEKYAEQRQKLISIYSDINSLFAYLQYGGTYFGHQHSRIFGYAEYSVFLYSLKEHDLEKTYDITQQKALYISSLEQLVKDESSIDNNTWGKEKDDRIKSMNEIVGHLDSLIADNFYLRRAQEFQYGHYEYW